MIPVDIVWSIAYSTSLEHPNSKVETLVVAASAAPAVHVHVCNEHQYRPGCIESPILKILDSCDNRDNFMIQKDMVFAFQYGKENIKRAIS